MKFHKKQKSMEGIPTASMPDIVFMLLIFFMVTTVLKKFDGLPLDLPHARKIEKLTTKRHVSYIWVSKGLRGLRSRIGYIGRSNPGR